MNINDTCTGCEACLSYCTQGAISMNADTQAVIDRELCVECGVCIDTGMCPVSAFEEDHDEVAEFKRPYGRLLLKHLAADSVVEGSGYDVKTNDVTGKIPEKSVIMRLELNRPRGGIKFGDVEQIKAGMEQLGWHLGMSSRSRSVRETRIADKAAEQRILTCHLELVLDPEKIPDVVRDITGFVAERDLWVSINVVGVAATIGHTQNILEAAGLCMEPVAKVNLGLGRKQ